jgi:hypothetical protein
VSDVVTTVNGERNEQRLLQPVGCQLSDNAAQLIDVARVPVVTIDDAVVVEAVFWFNWNLSMYRTDGAW